MVRFPGDHQRRRGRARSPHGEADPLGLPRRSADPRRAARRGRSPLPWLARAGETFTLYEAGRGPVVLFATQAVLESMSPIPGLAMPAPIGAAPIQSAA